MAETSNSFADVMARLRVGDEAAAREVFQRFAGRLVARARARLDRRLLGRRVDAEDVVQSAYRSFFVRHGEGQFQVEGWGGLWSLLVLITLRKCANQVQHHRRDCRDVQREAQPGGEDGPTPEPVDPEPTAQEAALLTETLEGLLGELDGPDREIIELSLQGYTALEIKERLGRAERSVRRIRERFRDRLERLRQQD